MSDDFDIQPPYPDDLPAIIALWRERMMIISQSAPHLRRHMQAEADYLSALRHWLDTRTAVILCAKKNHVVLGYIITIHRDDKMVIMDMALDAHAYHRGLAKALFLAVQTSPMSQPIIIRVARYYAVEQAFWRGLGAQEWTNHTWETNPLYQWMILSSDPPPKPI